MEKLQNPIDEKFDKLIEFGLKTGKIKKSLYIPVKCYESDDDSIDWDSISQEEIKFLHVIENGAIDKMLKNNGINVFEKK